MPRGLSGRALRDFIGVAGVKMRHMQRADTEPLSSRLALMLERLGTEEEQETEAATRSASKKGTPNDPEGTG